MSSHDLALRTHTALQLKEGVQEATLVQAFLPFMEMHQGAFEQGQKVSLADFETEDCPDTFVALGMTGELTFSIACRGPGLGEFPEGFAEFRNRLMPLLATGGIVEIVDHEMSAANVEAVIGTFVPSDTDAGFSHQLELDIAYATDLLQGHLKPEDLQWITSLIRDKANGLASSAC